MCLNDVRVGYCCLLWMRSGLETTRPQQAVDSIDSGGWRVVVASSGWCHVMVEDRVQTNQWTSSLTTHQTLVALLHPPTYYFPSNNRNNHNFSGQIELI